MTQSKPNKSLMFLIRLSNSELIHKHFCQCQFALHSPRCSSIHSQLCTTDDGAARGYKMYNQCLNGCPSADRAFAEIFVFCSMVIEVLSSVPQSSFKRVFIILEIDLFKALKTQRLFYMLVSPLGYSLLTCLNQKSIDQLQSAQYNQNQFYPDGSQYVLELILISYWLL